MEGTESVGSLIYCWVSGPVSEHLSPSLFSLCSVRAGSLLCRLITDIFTLVFFPPFCPQSSLCLDLLQETTASPDYSQIYTLAVFAYLCWFNMQLFLVASEGPFNFEKVCTFQIQNEQFPSSRGFGRLKHDSYEIFIDSIVDVHTGWWIISLHWCINHRMSSVFGEFSFATKTWLSPVSSHSGRSEL